MHWIPVVIIAVALLGFFLLKRASFVPEEQARKLLQQGALVVDVRNPDEFNSRHLPNAVNVPLGSLKTQAPARLPDRNQVLLLHCVSGVRSGMAAGQLKGLGYANVFNLGSYSRAEALVRNALTEGK